MNKIVIGAIVLILGVAFGVYVFGGNFKPAGAGNVPSTANNEVLPTTSPATASDSGETVASFTVNFTDNGFVPKSLTVKVGTTVRFTNESSGQMHVASNPHPTHTLLPGFDELQAVDKGGFYDYQFIKVGTWGYHNHLTPQVTGTVVVTP